MLVPLHSPLCLGPAAVSRRPRATACRTARLRRDLRPAAALAAGFVSVAQSRLRSGTACSAEADRATEAVQLLDSEKEALHDHLMQLDMADLRRLADDLDVLAGKRPSRAGIITRLMSPAIARKTKDKVSPAPSSTPAISPAGVKGLEAYLETVAAKNFPPKAGWARASEEEEVQAVSEAAEAAHGTLQICDVRTQLLTKDKRTKLQSLKVGKQLKGELVEVSLLDGLRFDIGAEVDAMVPLLLQDQDLARDISKKFPLGQKAQVTIQEVSTDPGKRFPLICSVEGLPESAARAVVQSPEAAEQLQSAPLDDWEPEGKIPVRKDLENLPRRPPPEVIKSLGADGRLQEVKVPAEYRSAAAKPSKAGQKAWAAFAKEQVEDLRGQLLCRERLAADLGVIESDLRLGRVPSIPTELLGLTVLEDGQSCLVPVPDGDCLKFQTITFDDGAALDEWVELCQRRHPEAWVKSSKAGPTDQAELRPKGQLAKFFACADAWHARAVKAVEAVELQRLGWTGEDVADDDTLADDLSRMIESIPELKKLQKED